MMTATNRNVGDERSPMRLLANSAYPAASTGTCGWLRKRYAVAGYWAGTTINGTEAAIARLQRNNVHSFQRPDSSAPRVRPDADDAQRAVGLHGVPQDLRRARAVRVEHRLQVAGLRQQRPRIHPAGRSRSRRATGSSGGTTSRASTSAASGSTSTSGAARISTAIAWASAATSMPTGRSRTTGAPGSASTASAAASTTAPRAAGRGPTTNANGSFWSYVNTDDRKPVAFDTFLGGGYSEFGPHFFDVNPGLTFRPLPSLSVSGGLRFNKSQSATRSG